MSSVVEFSADKVKISGPRIDGSYVVSFEVGEYTWDSLKELPNLNGKVINVKVTTAQ